MPPKKAKPGTVAKPTQTSRTSTASTASTKKTSAAAARKSSPTRASPSATQAVAKKSTKKKATAPSGSSSRSTSTKQTSRKAPAAAAKRKVTQTSSKVSATAKKTGPKKAAVAASAKTSAKKNAKATRATAAHSRKRARTPSSTQSRASSLSSSSSHTVSLAAHVKRSSTSDLHGNGAHNSSTDSTASSGWEDVPSSLFSQATRAQPSSTTSIAAPSTSRSAAQMEEETRTVAPEVSQSQRTDNKTRAQSKKKKGRVEADDAREKTNEAPLPTLYTPPRSTRHPTSGEHHHSDDTKEANETRDEESDESHIPSPLSLTADSEGRRSATAFRQSLFQQQQQQPPQPQDDAHVRARQASGDITGAPPEPQQAPLSGSAVVKELFQRPPRGIPYEANTPAHVQTTTTATAADEDAPDRGEEEEEQEEVLIPSDESDREASPHGRGESPMGRYTLEVPPPPADTATPPPSSLTLPTHQLPAAGTVATSAPRSSRDHTPPHRTSLSIVGAISPADASARTPPLSASHHAYRVALDVDADEETFVVVEASPDGRPSTHSPRGSQGLHGDINAQQPAAPRQPFGQHDESRAALTSSSSAATMPALGSYTLSRHPTHLSEPGHSALYNPNHVSAIAPSLPLSPSPQAPPRASQGHLRLGSVSRPRSPVAASHGANTNAFQTPPRLPSRPQMPHAAGGNQSSRCVGDGVDEDDRAGRRQTTAHGLGTTHGAQWGAGREEAHTSALFPRDPPSWRSPQSAQMRLSPQGSAVNSHMPSPFSLSHAPTPGTLGGASSLPQASATHSVGTDRHNTHTTREASSRPSAQLVTRAAATRPTAAPATMWICIDEDDDDDLEIPTSPTSPTLKHMVIAPREPEVGRSPAMKAASPALSVPAALQQMSAAPLVKREFSASGAAGASADDEQRSFLQQAHLEKVAELAAEANARQEAKQPVPLGAVEGVQHVVEETCAERSPPNEETSQTGTSTAAASARASSMQRQAVSGLTAITSARPLREPIADVLSPTFRPRRGVIPLNRAPTQRLSPLPSGCYIRMDDSDDDEDGEDREAGEGGQGTENTTANRVDGERRGSQHSVVSSLYTSPLKDTLRVDGSASHSPARLSATLAARAASFASLIADDDSDEEEDKKKGVLKPLDAHGGEKADTKGAVDNAEAEPETPVRNIKQLLFPATHVGGTSAGGGHGEGLLFRRPAKEGGVAAAGGQTQAHHKKKSGHSTKNDTQKDWGRPVDVLQREFFNSKLTKKSFMEAARKAISEEHFLQPGEFWTAFESAEFVGEGSFGLVWRCRSVEGDLVAVKSCPISLASRANIDDSFSTVREVATMRFLSEMQVPYVLPMHSAFFVTATEALPPSAMDALLWRRAEVKKAEAAALENQVRLLSKGKKLPARRGQRRCADADTETEEAPVLTLEEETQRQLRRLREAGSEAAAAERQKFERVKLPRFLSITEEDVLEGEATIFLVLELCDGDLEGIRRTDGLTKGVAFCVSSALAAMHELGLLHLDLKPSNILYAYEHGPSQQPPFASVSAESAAATCATAVTPSSASVKFYLSDFGNCRVVGPSPHDTVEDAFGTFEYMDLPALKDKICSRATDTFSLGATLYELLFGRRVYPKCQDPKCVGDEDHTRHCFVAAAGQPIVLPIGSGVGMSTPENALTADKLAAKAGLKRKSQAHKGKSGVRGQTRKAEEEADLSPASVASSTVVAGTKLPMTVLQKLTAALLQQDPHERMTAEHCRACLISAYNITQEEEGRVAEAHEQDRVTVLDEEQAGA